MMSRQARALASVAAVVAVVGACATPAERAARAEREVDEMIVVFGPACEKLGYGHESDAWRDCVLRLGARDSLERLHRAPATSTCVIHRGFAHCTSF